MCNVCTKTLQVKKLHARSNLRDECLVRHDDVSLKLISRIFGNKLCNNICRREAASIFNSRDVDIENSEIVGRGAIIKVEGFV